MQIGLDIGGTFTDIVALDRDGRLALTKVPSTPKDLLEGIGAATQRILDIAGAKPADVERFIHGTTVATNAILEQKGAVTAVLTTAGFEDVLELGRMKRSRMYDLATDPETPTFLAPRRRRVGVRERLDAKGRVLVPLWAGFSYDHFGKSVPFFTSAVLVIGVIALGYGIDDGRKEAVPIAS